MWIKIIVTIGMCIMLCRADIASQSIDTTSILQQIDSLTETAYKHIRESRYESAHAVYRDALKFAISALGENHIHIGHLRHMLGVLYSDTRYSSDTKYQFLEALRIKKRHLPPDHPSIALTTMNLGNVYEKEDNLYLAEIYYLQARDIWKKDVGSQDEHFGSVQHHLGRIYAQQSRDKEALECLRDALRIKESLLGPENPELGHLLNLMAAIYLRQGSYVAYEVCALRAADIWNKQRGIDDLLYFQSRHNLAVIHELMGNYALALSLAEEAEAGKRKILGPNDPDVALSLITLATIHAASGQQDSITVLLETAREILEKEIELYRLEYSWVLHTLGRILISNHDYRLARTYLAKSLEIKEKLVGTENLDYRSTLIAYANALVHINAADTARVLLSQQRNFYEYNQLTTHVDYLQCLELLSDIAVQEHRYDDAIDFLQTVNQINRQRISSLSEYGSEQEMYASISEAKPAFHKYLSLGFSAPMMKPEMRRELYELVLFYKGFVLDRYFEIRNHIVWNPVSLGVFRSLVAQKRILAEQNEKLLHERKGIVAIEQEINRLEVELAGTLNSNQRPGMTFDKVRDALQSDEVAVEYVEYHDVSAGSPGIIRFGAILVRPGVADPVFIPLTGSDQLQGTIMISGTPGRDYVARIYEKGSDLLYQVLWKSLEPWLDGVKLVYVAPAGLLHRINFGAIESPDQNILGGTYDIVRCLSTAQAELEDEMTYDNPDCAVFGGIDYDLDTSAVSSNQTIFSDPEFVYDESGGIAMTDSALRGDGWTFLKGSEREIYEIDRILQQSQLKPSIYRGRQATEEQFKSLGRSRTRSRSPRVLHLSTHGYFFPDPLEISEHLTRSDGAPIFRSSDHPMVRSGLILAGANYAWENGHAYRNGMDDGILTAYEISLMDLSDTELVVLSACETGLGDLAGNEGVLGLQRAFKIAGVKNLIMSLWRVPDAATAQLMTLFYQNWLERRMSARHALAMAQKDMRDHGWEHFYWAGFVIVE